MYEVTRRDLVLSAAAAAMAFGLTRHVAFIGAARAQKAPEPGKGFRHFKIGDIEMTMVYDGLQDRPNEAGFVRNAAVADVKEALKAAGLPEDNIPNLFTVPVARISGHTILFDAGTGGQIGPKTGLMAENIKAAGIDPATVSLVLLSHFHPDHIFGLMAKDTNAPIYPDAQIIASETEYKFWTDPAVFSKLPQPRHALAQRIQAVFPGWKDKGRIKLIGDNVEVAPGIRSIFAPGHTPGHTAWHISSGRDQFFVLADTVTFNPLFLRNPGWQAAYDTDGPLAETTRHKLIDRTIAEKAMVASYHFIFPAAGMLAKDGAGYAISAIA
jgi:glyoxylase-like metal-dependent hydrolase (beta-lactamase superfamily II)